MLDVVGKKKKTAHYSHHLKTRRNRVLGKSNQVGNVMEIYME